MRVKSRCTGSALPSRGANEWQTGWVPVGRGTQSRAATERRSKSKRASPMNVTVHNASIYVKIQGSGVPTMFVHGNPDSSLLWNGVIGEVQSKLQCFAPDLPGFGRSELPADMKFSLEEM